MQKSQTVILTEAKETKYTSNNERLYTMLGVVVLIGLAIKLLFNPNRSAS